MLVAIGAGIDVNIPELLTRYGWWAFFMLFLLVVAVRAGNEVGPEAGRLIVRFLHAVIQWFTNRTELAHKIHDAILRAVGLDDRDPDGIIGSGTEQQHLDVGTHLVPDHLTSRPRPLITFYRTTRWVLNTWAANSATYERFGVALRLFYAAESTLVYGIGAAILVPAARLTSLFVALTALALFLVAITLGHHHQINTRRLMWAGAAVLVGAWSIAKYSGWNGSPGTVIDVTAAITATIAVIAGVTSAHHNRGWAWAKRTVIAAMLSYAVANFVNLFYLPRVATFPWPTVVLAAFQLVMLTSNAWLIRRSIRRNRAATSVGSKRR